MMNGRKRNIIIKELAWLVGIFLASVMAEYIFFNFVDINPIISVKIQGLIGLLVIGYGLRASYRIWENFQKDSDFPKNGLPPAKSEAGKP